MIPECSILHIDMDAFFASVEQLDNPQLRGQPVVVGYDGPRGVVAAASYEARKFGSHSAQPMTQAKRLCSNLLIVPNRMDRYREISKKVFAIFDEFSPVVEPLSVDEAFLDLSGTQRLLGPPEEVAKKIKQRIKTEIGLTASVGIASNKFLAKLASDLEKPNGLTVIRAQDVDTILPLSQCQNCGESVESPNPNFQRLVLKRSVNFASPPPKDYFACWEMKPSDTCGSQTVSMPGRSLRIARQNASVTNKLSR